MASGVFYPAASADDGWGNAPSTFIAGGSGNLMGGSYKSFIRFVNVTIPKDATITSAYIRFYCQTARSSSTDITFGFEDTGDAGNPTNWSELDGITTGTTTTWTSVPSWTIGGGAPGYDTPDLKASLQDVINHASWASGNDALVVAYGGAAERLFFTYDSGSNFAELHVEWDEYVEREITIVYGSDQLLLDEYLTPSFTLSLKSHLSMLSTVGSSFSAAECTGLYIYPGHSIDDGYCKADGSDFHNDENWNKIGDTYVQFVRFPEVPIRRPSTIVSAVFKFYSNTTVAASGSSLLSFEASENPDVPVDCTDLLSRSQTDTVAFPDAGATQGQYFYSPEVKTILQDIVDQPSWEQNNPAMLIWESNTLSGVREIGSYDNSMPVGLFISWIDLTSDMTHTAMVTPTYTLVMDYRSSPIVEFIGRPTGTFVKDIDFNINLPKNALPSFFARCTLDPQESPKRDKDIVTVIYSDVNQYTPKVAHNVNDIKAIYQSIHNILSTNRYERLFNPEFGADLEEVLFELMDEITADFILTQIFNAITRWDDRVELIYSECSVIPDYDNNRYEITLVFNIKGFEDTRVYRYEGDLTRGPGA